MWKPMDDYVVRFDDKTAEERTSSEFSEMTERIAVVAEDYGFGFSMSGSWPAIKKVAVSECLEQLKMDFFEKF